MGTPITVQSSANKCAFQNTRTTIQFGVKELINQPRKTRVLFKTGAEDIPFVIETKTGRMHRVVEIQDRWRIDDEWWRDREIARMYFQCILDNGSQKIIFKDLCTGQWYHHVK